MKKLFLVDVHANAVGAGIGLSIHAMQRGRELVTPEAWVFFCINAAEEAYAAAMEDPIFDPSQVNPARQLDPHERGAGEDTAHFLLRTLGVDNPEPFEGVGMAAAEAAAHEAASTAFRLCMPNVTGRRTAQAYIACIGAGAARKYLDGKTAKALLYVAQLALSAHPKRTHTPRQTRRRAGFTPPPTP